MAEEDGRGFHLASAYVTVSLDETELDADIAGLDSKLAGIRGKAIGLGINEAQVDAAIAGIQAKLEGIRGQNAGVGISQADLDAEVADIEAKLAALGAEDVQVRVGLSGGTESLAEMGSLTAAMKLLEANTGRLADAMLGLKPSEDGAGDGAGGLRDTLAGLSGTASSAVERLIALAGSATSAADAAKYAYAATQLAGIGAKGVGDQSQGASPQVSGLGRSLGALGQQASSAHGWMGLLTKDITLWGGALGDVHMVGMIPLWHILLDGILETTIAFTEATVALVAFGLAAAPAAEDIVTHVKSVDDVVKSLGVDIPPVTGHLHDLGKALAPQIVELYGGALNTLSSAASPLARIVTGIATGFDDWMAKLDLFMDKQSHADGLISAGGDVLQQMSVILDNLGVSLENLVKADPGTVHFLGDLLEGASKLIEVFTELPTPLLYSVLALHSFLLWGGLVGTGVSKLLLPVRALSLALGGVGKEASAVGQLGEEAGGLDRLKAVLGDIGTGFATFGSNAATFAKSTGALGEAAQASVIPLADLRTAESTAAAESTGLLEKLAGLATNPLTWVGAAAAGVAILAYAFRNAQDATGQWITTLNQGLGNDTWFNTLQSNMGALSEVNVRLTAQQQQLSQAMTASAGAVTGVATRYGVYSDTAQEAAISAGHLTQSVGELQAEQEKLTTTQKAQISYLGTLGHSYGTTLTQSMALATVAGVGISQVTKVGSKAYQEAVQQVANLVSGYKAMSVQGGLLSNSVNAVTFASEQQSSKVEALTQAWTAFISMVTGGESSFDTFETQIAGLSTAAGTVSQIGVSSGKASLSISATGATAATAKAQIDSLSASGLQLNQTFGQGIIDANSEMNSLLMMASAAGLGAKGTAMLTQAGKDMVAQMLPMAKGSKEATAQLYALAQQAGYRGPDAFQSLVTWVGKAGHAENNLQQITSQLTVASANLGTDVANLSNAIGQGLTQAMQGAIFQASGGEKAFDAFAGAVLGGSGGLAALKPTATALAAQLLEVSGTSTQAKDTFETMSIQMGLTKQQADKLWASVKRVAEAEDSIPAHVSSAITITEILTQGGTTPGGGGGMHLQHASGGQVHGGSGRPGADDIPALLSDDEYVVRAPAVHKYGVGLFESLNAMKYAGGGQVGAGAYYSGPPASPAAADRAPITVIQNYNGPQHPTPEMSHAMMLNLTSAISMAG